MKKAAAQFISFTDLLLKKPSKIVSALQQLEITSKELHTKASEPRYSSNLLPAEEKALMGTFNKFASWGLQYLTQFSNNEDDRCLQFKVNHTNIKMSVTNQLNKKSFCRLYHSG